MSREPLGDELLRRAAAPRRKLARRASAPPIQAQPAPDTTSETRQAQAVSTIELVPLNLLRISAHNVNTVNAEHDIPGLAEEIHRHGLLQNLAAHPELDGGYGVFAGGRRLRALWHLRDTALVPADWLVPVRIGAEENARELSLAENVHRVPMNPVDEFEAYSRLVTDHGAEPDPIAFVAKRFQRTRTYIEQRLRLAALAPEILEALRANEIRLESANAYAGFDDHALQAIVFRAETARQLGAKHEPRAIRDGMRSRTYPSTIRQARYLGLEAYEAAGGRVDRDLFMTVEEGDRLLDPSLVDRLAREKAEEELAARVRRNGFATGELVQGFAEIEAVAMPRPPLGYVPGPVVPTTARTRLDELLPRDERKACIGIYALGPDADRLVCVGWWAPMAPPNPPAPAGIDPVAALVRPGASPETVGRFQSAIAEIDGSADKDRAEKARAARVLRLAARLAVQDAFGGALDGYAVFPGDHDAYLPAFSADDEAVTIAVQIRMPRSSIDAAIADAEAQIGGEISTDV